MQDSWAGLSSWKFQNAFLCLSIQQMDFTAKVEKQLWVINAIKIYQIGQDGRTFCIWCGCFLLFCVDVLKFIKSMASQKLLLPSSLKISLRNIWRSVTFYPVKLLLLCTWSVMAAMMVVNWTKAFPGADRGFCETGGLEIQKTVVICFPSIEVTGKLNPLSFHELSVHMSRDKDEFERNMQFSGVLSGKQNIQS